MTHATHIKTHGFTVIILVLFITSIAVFISVSVSQLGILNTRMGYNISQSNQSFYVSESGIEDSTLRITKGWVYDASESITLGDATATFSITDSATEPTHKIITSAGNTNNRFRTLQAIVERTDQPASFSYAAFGDNDLHTDSHDNDHYSVINGNIWSNDDLTIQDGNTVNGNVVAKGELELESANAVITGDVQADEVELESGTTINGNVTAVSEIDNEGVITGTATTDPGLVIGQLTFPSFDYATYKTQAQGAGTFYNTNNDFITFIETQYDAPSSTYIIPTGVYYVANKIELNNLAYPDPVIVSGTLISEDKITIKTTYTHTSANNLPLLVAKKKIEVKDDDDAGPVSLTGLVYSEQEIHLHHDELADKITVTGSLIAEEVHICESAEINYDAAVLATQGFDISGSGSSQTTLIAIYETS